MERSRAFMRMASAYSAPQNEKKRIAKRESSEWLLLLVWAVCGEEDSEERILHARQWRQELRRNVPVMTDWNWEWGVCVVCQRYKLRVVSYALMIITTLKAMVESSRRVVDDDDDGELVWREVRMRAERNER
mmetsp:Transcript_6293/g.13425  ORF Transcript_6293/g.13425 Transcript_6293/m.13425 type:complete len:132 (-) Transcript_6293:196-591(-)